MQRAYEARLKQELEMKKAYVLTGSEIFGKKVVSSVSIVSFVLDIGKQGLKKVFGNSFDYSTHLDRLYCNGLEGSGRRH